jgi:hypothetical protein
MAAAIGVWLYQRRKQAVLEQVPRFISLPAKKETKMFFRKKQKTIAQKIHDFYFIQRKVPFDAKEPLPDLEGRLVAEAHNYPHRALARAIAYNMLCDVHGAWSFIEQTADKNLANLYTTNSPLHKSIQFFQHQVAAEDLLETERMLDNEPERLVELVVEVKQDAMLPINYFDARSDHKFIYQLKKNDEIVYIGQTDRPRQRMFEHFTDGKDYDSAPAFAVPGKYANLIEGAMIRALKPKLNKNVGPGVRHLDKLVLECVKISDYSQLELKKVA